MDLSQTTAVHHTIEQLLECPSYIPGMPLNLANALFEQNEWWQDLIGGNINQSSDTDENNDIDGGSDMDEGSNFDNDSQCSLDTESAAIVDVPVRERVQRMASENNGYAEDLGQLTLSVTDASKDLQRMIVLDDIAAGKRSSHPEALRAILMSSEFRSSNLDRDTGEISNLTLERLVRKSIERLVKVQESKIQSETSLLRKLLRKLAEKDRELSEANDIIRERMKSDELARSEKRKPEEEPAEADRPFKKTYWLRDSPDIVTDPGQRNE